jgi:hypothetical protein
MHFGELGQEEAYAPRELRRRRLGIPILSKCYSSPTEGRVLRRVGVILTKVANLFEMAGVPRVRTRPGDPLP